LEPVADSSCEDPASENLEALKALIPLYVGKVRRIFIDPPYNTKSAFEHYDDKLEYSQWLPMMYLSSPRKARCEWTLAGRSIFQSLNESEGGVKERVLSSGFQ
jgi:adenine-specific DNA-methyltransferase